MVVLWPSGLALADEEDGGTHDKYRQLITEAVTEFQLGQWAEAIVLFRRAHQLRPSAKTHRGLAQAYFEARDYVHAIPHIRAALAAPGDTFNEKQRATLERLLERSLSFVGTVHVQLSPKSATVLVDGVPVEEDKEHIWLNPGPHTLTATAPGYHNFEQHLEARGGIDLQVQAELAPVISPTPPPTGAAPQPLSGEGAGASASPLAPHAVPPSNPKAVFRTLGWVGAGLAAAFFGGAFVTWRLHEDGPVAKWNQAGCTVPLSDECLGYQDESETLTTVSTALLVTGGIFTASAVTMFVLGSGNDKEPQVACSAGALNLRCAGHF